MIGLILEITKRISRCFSEKASNTFQVCELAANWRKSPDGSLKTFRSRWLNGDIARAIANHQQEFRREREDCYHRRHSLLGWPISALNNLVASIIRSLSGLPSLRTLKFRARPWMTFRQMTFTVLNHWTAFCLSECARVFLSSMKDDWYTVHNIVQQRMMFNKTSCLKHQLSRFNKLAKLGTFQFAYNANHRC